MSKLRLRLLAAICLAGSIGTTLAALQELAPATHFDVRPGALQELGNVGEDETPLVEFELVNVTRSPIHIGGVTAGCGCVSYSLPEEEIPPGGTGKLSLELSTAGMEGPVAVHAAVAYRSEGATDFWVLPLVIRMVVASRGEKGTDETEEDVNGTEKQEAATSQFTPGHPILAEFKDALLPSTTHLATRAMRVLNVSNRRSRSPWALAAAVGVSPTMTWADDTEPAAQGVPTLEELLAIEEEIIASRKRLSSGQVFVRADSYHFGKGEWSLFSKVHWDENRWRTEVGGARTRRIVTWSPERGIAVSPGDKHPKVIVYTPSHDDRPRPPLGNPRLLGLVAWWFESIDESKLNWHFLNPTRRNFEITEVMHEDKRVLRVTYDLDGVENGVKVDEEYWLSPDAGSMPVYIVSSEQDSGSQSKFELWTHWRRISTHNEEDVWFPERVEFQRTRDGVVVSTQTLHVESASFLAPLDDDLFSLAGLDLPDGTIVDMDGQARMWSGGRLLPGVEDVFPRRERRLRTQVMLVVSAVALALVAAGLLWKSWRGART